MTTLETILDAIAMVCWPLVGLGIYGAWHRGEPLSGTGTFCAVWACLSVGIRAGMRLTGYAP